MGRVWQKGRVVGKLNLVLVRFKSNVEITPIIFGSWNVRHIGSKAASLFASIKSHS
jgi:hypothetical protein